MHVRSLAFYCAPAQCTGANPRYPLVKDLRGIFLAAWTRPILPLKSLEHYTPAAHASNN